MIGTVSLTAGDAERLRRFYEETVGLRSSASETGTVALAAEDGPPLVELVSEPDAPERPPGTTGLFHFAILVPDRAALARSLDRVIAGGWRLTGASDHLVSEALYLSDPEGNGIEIYRDRPREEWRTVGGELAMATLPLDLDGLAAESGDPDGAPMPAGTKIGHVHLNVADIPATERFYADGVGLDVTVRSYPGAIFLASGGYHHHIGANIWAGEGAPPPPAGARGLRHYELVLEGEDEPAEARRRLAEHGFEASAADGGLSATDPSGNAVLIRGSGPRTGSGPGPSTRR
jgi:catechol 2,3-dioxygenase